MDWQTDVEQWAATHRKHIYSSANLIHFFDFVFKFTQCPYESWFGIHQRSISLVVGNIYLAGFHLSGTEKGIWLLVDSGLNNFSNVHYEFAKSTKKYIPLFWLRFNELDDSRQLFNHIDIWNSYSQATNKILRAPISESRNDEFQIKKGKQRLCDILDLKLLLSDEKQNLAFNAENIEDKRQKILREIRQRQGQSEFRQSLLNAYHNQCAISHCNIVEAIEAAHIIPYQGQYTNHVVNGLLLRADIHKLFDLFLLSIDPSSYTIKLAPELQQSCYKQFQNKKLNLPTCKKDYPDKKALGLHYQKFLKKLL